jgi:hypothetical protein
MQTTKSVLFGAVLVTLTSCGGGGGGGSSAPVVPTTPIQLTAANAVAAAGGATLAGLGAAGAGGFFELALSPSQPPQPNMHFLMRIIKQQIDLLVGQPQAAQPLAGVVSCSNATQTGPTSATITFTNCSDGAGDTLNGTISIANIDVVPSTSFSGVAAVALTLKTVGLPDFSVSGSGINVSEQVAGSVDTITMTGSAISTVTGTVAERLASYNLSSIFDDAGNTEIDTVTFDYASTKIGGQVHVTTITPPVTSFASDFPESGLLSITGTQGAIHVNINGDAGGAPPQVTIQLDADGDNAIDNTFNKNWLDLDV